MEIIVTRRKRRSQAQWQALIRQQKESDQSVTLFCQQQNLSSKTFYKHRREYQAGKNIELPSKGFIKIKKPSSLPLTQTDSACILHYQNCKLQIQSKTDANWVAQIMQALS